MPNINWPLFKSRVAKIIHYQSGPIQTDPVPAVKRKEIVVTPEPKTKAQLRANAKAAKLRAALDRQFAPKPAQSDKSRKKAQRRRKRKLYADAAKDALAKGTISPEQAKNMLPTRRNRVTNESTT
jgi:hypothetical protein